MYHPIQTTSDMHLKRTFVSTILFLLCAMPTLAYELKEVKVWSKSMKKNVPVNIITPQNYKGEKSFPVIYLLHGHGDNHTGWSRSGVVGKLADQHNVIVVMPDGGRDSWYFDSPIEPSYRYETFVSKELIAYIDASYSTVKDRKARAITGLSMGGHGAFYLAFRHQEAFGNVGSLSGGLDIRPFPKNWNIGGRLGTKDKFPERWEENTVINMTHLLKPGHLNIIFECGTSDFFYEVNCNMHQKLLKEGIPHDFTSRPGAHNWDYWLNGIKYQFLYFADRFEEYKNTTITK